MYCKAIIRAEQGLPPEEPTVEPETVAHGHRTAGIIFGRSG